MLTPHLRLRRQREGEGGGGESSRWAAHPLTVRPQGTAQVLAAGAEGPLALLPSPGRGRLPHLGDCWLARPLAAEPTSLASQRGEWASGRPRPTSSSLRRSGAGRGEGQAPAEAANHDSYSPHHSPSCTVARQHPKFSARRFLSSSLPGGTCRRDQRRGPDS